MASTYLHTSYIILLEEKDLSNLIQITIAAMIALIVALGTAISMNGNAFAQSQGPFGPD